MTFWVAGAALVGSVAAGSMSANAAEDAANAQVGASDRATQAQRDMFDKQVQLQEPWRQAGIAGLNRLGYLTGLSPNGFGGSSAPGAPTQETADQIRARLLPQFSTSTTEMRDSGGSETTSYSAPFTTTTVNEPALQAAIQAEIAKQQQQAQTQASTQQAQTNALTDPAYGSLLRDFSLSDFQQDPGYQFRLSEGQKALERSAAARGGLFSGRAMKDTLRFAQGLGSQEYGSAFDRYNANNANRFNRLASLAGIGQTAANQTGAAAANFGNQIGSNIIGAGNAMAAGRVGSANAIGGGISQGVSMYQQQNLMNRLFPANSGGSNFTVPQGYGPSPSGFGGGGLMDELQGYGVFSS